MSEAVFYAKHLIEEDDIEAVIRTLKSTHLTQGPKVEEFENQFQDYLETSYALAVNSGTAALHVAALSLGINKGSRWLSPAISFAASTNCVLYCGGEVHFIDIDPITMCLDLSLLEEELKKYPPGYYQGVIAVDFAGYPMDMEKLQSIAQSYGLKIIEDSCHAPGAKFLNSKKIWTHAGNATYSDFSVFSFHPAKHICCGEGGMVVTRNQELYEKAKLFRTHGITKEPTLFKNQQSTGWYHEMQELGYNYRLSDIHAALGISQLKKNTIRLAERNRIANDYNDALANIDEITLPFKSDNVEHAYHLYVIKTKRRDELFNFLKSHNIHCQLHYIPIYRHPYYRKTQKEALELENSEKHFQEALSLPIFPGLSENSQQHVIDKIKTFFKK